ncbi:hypothetical protein EMMF5_003047, partial [Cystobasidiomycetes sp. EMM_F5]
AMLKGDQTSFANNTTEQSLINLPSWGFALASITSLCNLSSALSVRQSEQPKLNLLGYVHEIEPVGSIPLKKRSARTGRMEAERAAMILLDETGASLQVVMWDDYAQKWIGEYIRQGDVVYLERIAISEYKNVLQGTTVEGSRVQICYRTAAVASASDLALRPDLDLAWDLISRRVKALRSLAVDLA